MERLGIEKQASSDDEAKKKEERNKRILDNARSPKTVSH